VLYAFALQKMTQDVPPTSDFPWTQGNGRDNTTETKKCIVNAVKMPAENVFLHFEKPVILYDLEFFVLQFLV